MGCTESKRETETETEAESTEGQRNTRQGKAKAREGKGGGEKNCFTSHLSPLLIELTMTRYSCPRIAEAELIPRCRISQKEAPGVLARREELRKGGKDGGRYESLRSFKS